MEERKGMGSEMRGNDKISVNNGLAPWLVDQEEPETVSLYYPGLRTPRS